MPGEIQFVLARIVEPRDAEAWKDLLQIMQVQHVEFTERDLARADLFHRRLIFVSPRIGERRPVQSVTEGPRIVSASREMLARQSTSVPNTSKNSALIGSGMQRSRCLNRYFPRSAITCPSTFISASGAVTFGLWLESIS